MWDGWLHTMSVFVRESKGLFYLIEKNNYKQKYIEKYGRTPPKIYLPKTICGDALTELKKIPTESIDLILTDPPYGINFNTNYRIKNKLKTQNGIKGDDIFFNLLPEFMQEFYRVMKKDRHIYIFTRWDVYPRLLEEFKKYFKTKNLLVWVKNNWSMGDLSGAYASQQEMILYGHIGRRKLNGGRDTDILNFNRVSGNEMIHNHQKPINLLQYLILKSSNRDEIVLDPFLGVGSTNIASMKLCRKGIGIELDKEYVNITNNLIEKNKPTNYEKYKGEWKIGD